MSEGNGTERLKRIEAILERIEHDVVELKEANVEYRVRLENGQKAFRDMDHWRARMDSSMDNWKSEIEQRTAPKPIGTMKAVSLTLMIATVVGGSIWALGAELSKRPTYEQLDRRFSEHERRLHKAR